MTKKSREARETRLRNLQMTKKSREARETRLRNLQMTKKSREARETRLRNLHLIDKLRSVQVSMRYLAKLLEQRGDSGYCSAFNGDAEAIQTIIDDVSNETPLP